MTETNELIRNKALMDFRSKNFKELKNCLKVSMEIRDNSEIPARDRNSAVRNIAALLGAMTERGDVLTKGKARVRLDAPKVSDANKTELESLLDELQ